jgi:hypothetical protein
LTLLCRWLGPQIPIWRWFLDDSTLALHLYYCNIHPLNMTSHLRPDAFDPGQIVRKSFGLKKEVAGELERDYASSMVERVIAAGYVYEEKGMTFHLARSFGFCYGVDRAVDLAYETRQRFPNKKIFLTAQIIHNPRVNKNLQEMGIEITEDFTLKRTMLLFYLPLERRRIRLLHSKRRNVCW